jgi:hypothetical protein
MSLSSSRPPGAPSLTEVIVARTFAKPPSPFVDGEFLEALEHADEEAARAAGVAGPAAASGGGPQTGAGGTPNRDAQPAAAPQVDVRV